MRLIDADNLEECKEVMTTIHGECKYAVRMDDIRKMPTITVERPRGEWISCSERLPEECENVLAWIERDAWLDGNDYPIRTQEAAIGWHIEGRWHFDGYSGTTECLAWMPLPEPYNGGEAE